MYKIRIKIIKEKRVYLVDTNESLLAQNRIIKEINDDNIVIDFLKIEKVEYDNIFASKIGFPFFELRSEFETSEGTKAKEKILYNHESLIAAISDYEENTGRTIIAGTKTDILSILDIN
jgi:hypothetical protein